MKEFHGRASVRVDAGPDAAFGLLTDVHRPPDWNDAIEAVLAEPDALVDGAEWTVRMHPPRMPRWGSISRLEELDRDRRRFVYETRNADGNPSRVKWAWEVVGADGGAEVTVSWDCCLETLDRRLFGGPVRKRQLEREVPSSLAALAGELATADR